MLTSRRASGCTPSRAPIRRHHLGDDRSDVPAGGMEAEGFGGRFGIVEHRDDHIAGVVHRENAREGGDHGGAGIAAADDLLGGSGLAADPVARSVGLLAGAVGDDQPKQRPHLQARLLAEHPAALRDGMAAIVFDQGRRPPDAAVEQGGIAVGEVKRSDGDAVAVTDRHRRDLAPVRAGSQGPAALVQFDRDGLEKAHLAEEFLLARRAQLRRDLGGADVGRFLHDLGDAAGAVERVGVGDGEAARRKTARAIVHLAEALHDPGVHRHRHRERLEGRAELVDPERRPVEARLLGVAAGLFGLSWGSEVMAMTSPVWMSSTIPAAPIALNLVIAAPSSVSITPWTRASIDKATGVPRAERIAEAVLEHPLHSGDSVAVEIGPAEDVAGHRRLRIHSLRLAAELDGRLAERVDRRDQLRDGAAAQIEEGLPGGQHRFIFGGAALRHQLGELGRELGGVAEQAVGMDCDRPGVDRPGQRNAVAVDDIGARRDQGVADLAGAAAVGEQLKEEQPPGDQQGDAGEDQHHQHQPLIGQAQSLRALAGAAIAVGKDRGAGHQLPPPPLTLAGRGAAAASRTGLAAAAAGFAAGLAAAVTGLTVGLAAAVTGLAVGFAPERAPAVSGLAGVAEAVRAATGLPGLAAGRSGAAWGFAGVADAVR